MRSGDADNGLLGAFDLAGGCAATVVGALFAAAMVAPGHLGTRAMIMAITVCAVAAVLTDGKSSAGVAVLAALIFVGFLVHHDGDLTGSTAAWPYTLIIGLAALLGRGTRLIRVARPAGRRVARPAGRSARSHVNG